MNLLGFNISISRQPVSTHTGDGPVTSKRSVDGWLRGEDTQDTGPVLTNAYQQVVWVYRAINLLAEQVANTPFLFSVGERGRENLITSGPLLDLYSRPHPQINRFQYWELRVIWLMLRGECFRIPIFSDRSHSQLSTLNPQPGSKRRLTGVLILDPARFQQIIEDNQLAGWRYTGFGPNAPLASQVFLPEEVWFEKLPNPFDFWRGMSPLHVADTAAKTDYAASAFMKGLMENNADPGVIVRTDQQLDDTQQEQILAALRQRKRRAGTADRPLLLWSGAEIVKPKLSTADLQFLENRRFSRSEICAAFGVPEEILTTTEHAKYDVMAGARLNFIENRVAPLCARLEAEENITTIPALTGSTAAQIANQNSKIKNILGWFDLDSLPILQEARRSRLAAARAGFEMGIPFNELNRVLDLGFKPLPWGDVGHIPSSMQPASKSYSSS
jgi:HK97 family phage portal protein